MVEGQVERRVSLNRGGSGFLTFTPQPTEDGSPSPLVNLFGQTDFTRRFILAFSLRIHRLYEGATIVGEYRFRHLKITLHHKLLVCVNFFPGKVTMMIISVELFHINDLNTSSGSSGQVRGGAEKHEIYTAAFGGHLFYDLFSQGQGGPWPPRPPPPRIRY